MKYETFIALRYFRAKRRTGFISIITYVSVIGVVIGVAGGFFGRSADALVVMVIDIFMSFPGLLLAMVIAALLGPSLPNVMLAVGLGEFTMFARLVRSTVYVEKE